MALWKWTGSSYDKAPWHSLSKGKLKAMIYGSGKSLNDANPSPDGYMRFTINHAYLKVEPHVFIAMDEDFMKADFMNKPFAKVFRGNHCEYLVDGETKAKEFPETYFADVIDGGLQSSIFYNRGIDTQFYFARKTLIVTIHLALYMGFKHIAFSGCDFGGEYFDKQYGVMTERENRTLNEEFEFMKWFVPTCKTMGITLENTSKISRLNELIKE